MAWKKVEETVLDIHLMINKISIEGEIWTESWKLDNRYKEIMKFWSFFSQNMSQNIDMGMEIT